MTAGKRQGRHLLSKDRTKAGRHDTPSATETLGTNTEIGRKLRQYYDGIVAEEVPDRFMSLLEKLDQVESAHKSE